MAPVLHKVQSTQFVLASHSSYLWCPAEGAPAPFIVWRKNGIIVQNSTSIRYKLDIVKGNKETFSCEVKNNNQVTKKELVPYMESTFKTFRCKLSPYIYMDPLSPNRRFFNQNEHSTRNERLLYEIWAWGLYDIAES